MTKAQVSDNSAMDDLSGEKVPSLVTLINPTLQAIHRLGSSAKVNEIVGQVIDDMEFSEDVATRRYKDESTPALERHLASARTILKFNGYINNSQRGVWTLTNKGLSVEEIDPSTAQSNYLRSLKKSAPEGERDHADGTDGDIPVDDSEAWRSSLLHELKTMSPDAFERLCQRLLRESGFIEVEVTGRPGDGGIDGNGIIRLERLISFPVSFQCKRYSGNVPPRDVRDFRGAMQGRSEKGLIITTGGFTPAAKEEATRDGAPPIDLIDGEALMDLLKELRLGVKVTQRTVEDVELDPEFFPPT